jgi:hypothetical protein
MNTKQKHTEKASASQNRAAEKEAGKALTYQLPLDLLREFGCNRPSEYAHLVYKYNDCGPWTAFLILKNGELEAISSDNLNEYQDTTEWAVRHLIGIRHGTIVEGSDATFVADDLIFPFSEEERENRLSYLESEAESAWIEANRGIL